MCVCSVGLGQGGGVGRPPPLWCRAVPCRAEGSRQGPSAAGRRVPRGVAPGPRGAGPCRPGGPLSRFGSPWVGRGRYSVRRGCLPSFSVSGTKAMDQSMVCSRYSNLGGEKTINETVLRIRFPAPVRRATLGVVAQKVQKLAWTKSHSRDGEHSGRRSSNCHSSRVRRHGQSDDPRMWFGLFGSCVDLDGAGRIGCAHHSAQPHRLDWTPQPGQGGG